MMNELRLIRSLLLGISCILIIQGYVFAEWLGSVNK
jgi:hypothetical protein